MPQSDYPILGAEIARARKRFLAPSADKQTHNYDTECSNIYIYIYICSYDVGKTKCKKDFYIKTNCYLTVQRLGFLRLNNRLAAGEGVLDSQPHHNFGNFIETKISLTKAQSILYTMIKKKINCFCQQLLIFQVTFHKYLGF